MGSHIGAIVKGDKMDKKSKVLLTSALVSLGVFLLRVPFPLFLSPLPSGERLGKGLRRGSTRPACLSRGN